MDAFTTGSWTSLTRNPVSFMSGKSVGLLTMTSLSWKITCGLVRLSKCWKCQLFHSRLYGTVGAVIITFASYSSSSRWRKTSIWSVPRKPNRQPCPSALDDSLWIVTLRSVRVSLLMDSSNFGKSLLSTGYTPANTWNRSLRNTQPSMDGEN